MTQGSSGHELADTVQFAVAVPACSQGILDPYGPEPDRVTGLGLSEQVTVRRDDRADRGVSTGGDGITEQHDRFVASGHLDRSEWVSQIHHVGRVTTGAEGLFSFDEVQR